MPQMANITVKKNDGTTDIVYTAMIPSAGDKSAAIWRSNTIGSAAAFRPELQALSAPNGPKTARRVNLKYSYPSLVVGGDGKTSISDRLILDISAVVPQGMADADVNEAVSQGLNLCASQLIKDTVKAGFAPT
jgi:hypothetical protein